MTGAHLAYAFIVASNPDLKFVPSNNDEKIKCVMYCGPSNKSVDVVLGTHVQLTCICIILATVKLLYNLLVCCSHYS